MKIGIVGAEQAKFTPETEDAARLVIKELFSRYKPEKVLSGESPLGGVDWYAREEAAYAGIPFEPHPPASNRWADGFRVRNLEIAVGSDVVVCIALAEYPDSYPYERFDKCYHHTPPRTDHVKSGGCWTAREAIKAGNRGMLAIIPPSRVLTI